MRLCCADPSGDGDPNSAEQVVTLADLAREEFIPDHNVMLTCKLYVVG